MSKAVIPPSIGTGGSIFGGGGGVNCAKSGTDSSVNSMINLIVRFIGIVVVQDVSLILKRFTVGLSTCEP